eukprot:3455176-Prymnesium_polylepis.1
MDTLEQACASSGVTGRRRLRPEGCGGNSGQTTGRGQTGAPKAAHQKSRPARSLAGGASQSKGGADTASPTRSLTEGAEMPLGVASSINGGRMDDDLPPTIRAARTVAESVHPDDELLA